MGEAESVEVRRSVLDFVVLIELCDQAFSIGTSCVFCGRSSREACRAGLSGGTALEEGLSPERRLA